MIRLHVRPLVLLGLTLLLLWGAWLAQSALRKFLGEEPDFALARQETVYVLPEDGWIEFDLPPSVGAMRAVSNAEIAPEVAAAVERGQEREHEFRYALEYQLMDGREPLGEPMIYHHRTRLSRYIRPTTVDREGELVNAGFYLETEAVPLDARSLRLTLGEELARASRLRLRFVEIDPEIDPETDLAGAQASPATGPVSGAVIRVFARQELEQRKLRRRWFRLTSRDRRKMTRYHVYPHELLSERERLDLMRHLWAPVPPLGTDYQSRKLYLLRDEDFENVEPPSGPRRAGLVVPRGRRVTVRLPEELVRVRLELEPITFETPDPTETTETTGETPDVPPTGDPILVRRYDGGALVESFSVPWQGEAWSVVRPMDGGLLELEAPSPLAVRIFLEAEVDGERTEELELEPGGILRLYALRRDAPLEYRVLTADGAPTPFRIDLRANRPAGPLAVPYELVGRGGEVVATGRLVHPGEASLYDVLLGEIGPESLSERSRHYLLLPKTVDRIRFPGLDDPEREALVVLFNRPGGLERVFEVAGDEDLAALLAEAGEDGGPDDEDTRRSEGTTDGPIDPGRSWFFLRPTGDRATDRGETRLVRFMSRPRLADPRLAAGEYLWEAFEPATAWRAHELLLPRRPDTLLRREALGAAYRPVPANEPMELVFVDHPPGVPVRPTLIFLRPDDTPFTLVAHVGNKVLRRRLAGRRGLVDLPEVAAGEPVSLRLEIPPAEPAELFVNHSTDTSAVTRMKRLAQRFEGPLEFPVTKLDHGPEVLVIRYFKPWGRTEPTLLRIEIRDGNRPLATPLDDWTFRSRIYRIEPRGPADGAEPVPVLGRGEVEVDPGRAFYLRLGSDLAPGVYRLRIAPVAESKEGPKTPGGYLSVSRTVPGTFPARESFIEREVEQ